MSFRLLMLILDTCHTYGLIARAKGDKIVAEIPLENTRQQSDQLPELIEPLLDGIEAIAVARGPGSYTGLRIGLSLAMGLSLARDIPLLPLISLKAHVPQAKGKYVAAFDARAGGAYFLTEEGPRAGSIGDLELALDGVDILVSPDLPVLLPRLSRRPPCAEESRPSAQAHLAQALSAEPVQHVDALYLRLTQAERQQ